MINRFRSEVRGVGTKIAALSQAISRAHALRNGCYCIKGVLFGLWAGVLNVGQTPIDNFGDKELLFQNHDKR